MVNNINYTTRIGVLGPQVNKSRILIGSWSTREFPCTVVSTCYNNSISSSIVWLRKQWFLIKFAKLYCEIVSAPSIVHQLTKQLYRVEESRLVTWNDAQLAIGTSVNRSDVVFSPIMDKNFDSTISYASTNRWRKLHEYLEKEI